MSIIEGLEQGRDDEKKNLVSLLQAFYPTLNTDIILSNPETDISDIEYGSIPYCIDALKSKTAVETYKKIGKSTCKGINNIGLSTTKLGMQYTKQAALSIDMIASKQILNLNQYMKDKYKEYEENKTRDNSYEFDVDADEFEFNEVNIAKESEFECESAEYSDAISMGKDEVELNFAEVGNNCMFRFTKDMQGNIKQYMTLNNNMSQARVISESEYNKLYDNYTKIYGDKAEEKEMAKEVEYEI